MLDQPILDPGAQDRTELRLEASQLLSFGTYFNAFPASYWRRHTIVTEVELSVRVTGAGSGVTVYKSMAAGHSQRVDSAVVEGEGDDASANAVIALLARQRITVRQLRVTDATLDDAYLGLTATVYHLLGLYGGWVLVVVAAAQPVDAQSPTRD